MIRQTIGLLVCSLGSCLNTPTLTRLLLYLWKHGYSLGLHKLQILEERHWGFRTVETPRVFVALFILFVFYDGLTEHLLRHCPVLFWPVPGKKSSGSWDFTAQAAVREAVHSFLFTVLVFMCLHGGRVSCPQPSHPWAGLPGLLKSCAQHSSI